MTQQHEASKATNGAANARTHARVNHSSPWATTTTVESARRSSGPTWTLMSWRPLTSRRRPIPRHTRVKPRLLLLLLLRSVGRRGLAVAAKSPLSRLRGTAWSSRRSLLHELLGGRLHLLGLLQLLLRGLLLLGRRLLSLRLLRLLLLWLLLLGLLLLLWLLLPWLWISS